MRFLIKIILMVLVIGATLFASDVATVTGLNGKAYVDRGGNSISLATGDKLQEKDTISTDAKSKVQIIFLDETVVTVGGSSVFSIDEYLYEENQEPVARFGILKGAMKAITGKIGKIAPQRFSVATKTATIGIRGTNFSIIFDEHDTANIFCTYGAISVGFKGTEHMVMQGFYLALDVSGHINIREFTPKILKDISEKGFGKSVSKLGDVKSEVMLDNTKKYVGEIILKDISLDVKIGSDLEKYDEIKNKVHGHMPAVPTPVFNGILGFISGGVEDIGIGAIIFDSSNAFTADSEISYEFNVLTSTSDEDFTFKINTASSYTSKEKFTTSLDAVPDPQSFNTNFQISNSNFIATGDDLKDGDSMSWGEWNVAISYDDSSGVQQFRDVQNGFWVMGNPTKELLQTIGKVQYNGIYRAVDHTQTSSNIVNGVATMNIDFGADSAKLDITYGNGSRLFDLTIMRPQTAGEPSSLGTLPIAGQLADNRAKGIFYGPNAESVGGDFITKYKGIPELSGVYQVSK